MRFPFKKTLKPFLLPTYYFLQKKRKEWQTFHVPINKLLRGGENGIRAAKYAELTNHFMRPSTSVFESPHIKLLQLYEDIGEDILREEVFVKTPYYENALNCMRLTGAYFYDKPEKIKTLAERFIAQHKGQTLDLPPQPGQSDPLQPVWVRPIRYSSYYEVIDGNHRIARAIMRGDDKIPVMLYDREPALTPLQQILLDCLWIQKKKWLYQPVDAPEIKESWTLIRKSTDRMAMMKSFLKKHKVADKKLTSIDLGSSYGWFVKSFEELGFDAWGMERDPFGMSVGFHVYGVDKKQIIHSDLIVGLDQLMREKKSYNVVSLLSVLHHFVLHKSSTSPEDLIKKVDAITKNILFIDTGEEHEAAFAGALKGWSPAFIQKWLKKNTTFKEVIPLGVDGDKNSPFQDYYHRTLFACVK